MSRKWSHQLAWPKVGARWRDELATRASDSEVDGEEAEVHFEGRGGERKTATGQDMHVLEEGAAGGQADVAGGLKRLARLMCGRRS
jgi:hypothetical protein